MSAGPSAIDVTLKRPDETGRDGMRCSVSPEHLQASAATFASSAPSGGTDLLARLDGVSLRYPDGPDILQAIDLHLPAGSFHFLIGPSGAGKTSLLRLLCLALRPSSGRMRLFNVETAHASRTELSALRRRIGIVHQDFRLLPQLSVFANAALPLRLAGASENEVKRTVASMLERIGLLPLGEAMPTRLSGGEQQRLAIARALIVRPLLLVADEPTASVDERAAMRLVQLFQEVNRLGTTVLVATHNEALAMRFRHPRLRLENGRLRHEAAARIPSPLAERPGRRDPAAESR